MDVKDLRIFARVAAVNSLSAVAAEIDVSPGTISKRIQALEDELAVRLIDRTTRSSRLTEEGRIFLQRVERILSEMDHAQDEIAVSTGQASGRLRISAPASLQRQLVGPAILSFIEAYPGIEVCVDISDRVANLQEDGYDVTIRTGTLPDSSLKAKRLAPDRIIMVAAPAYVASFGAPQRVEDLTKHNCLLHGDLRSWTLVRGKEAVNVRVSGRLGSDSGELLHYAALEGKGILRASELAVADDISAGRLVRLMAEYELASDAAIWAVYPNVRHGLPRLRVFLEHLAEFCRNRHTASARGPAVAIQERSWQLDTLAAEALEQREPPRKRALRDQP